MNTGPHAGEEILSQQVIDELSQEPDAPDPRALPVSFDDEDPASAATELGNATLAIAERFLKMPLREDAGTNRDKDGHIRSFFLEGLKWSPETWDRWAEKYPKSGVVKPEWCAAFASYCARMAYRDAQRNLPATPSGSASEMAARFAAASRFLKREDLFAEDGCLKAGVTPPGAGDFVIWKGHVGLLKAIFPSGAFISIEGNTWRGSERHDGVYRCSRHATEKRADGSFKLVGFCLLASKDGVTLAAQNSSAAAGG